MIVERELLFNDDELKDEKYFPKYLVMRREVNSESANQGEW